LQPLVFDYDDEHDGTHGNANEAQKGRKDRLLDTFALTPSAVSLRDLREDVILRTCSGMCVDALIRIRSVKLKGVSPAPEW